jgi:hypothetical protein
MRDCVGGWGCKAKKNPIAATPEEFATFWYLFREDRSTNVEGVRGQTDRQTDGRDLYI